MKTTAQRELEKPCQDLTQSMILCYKPKTATVLDTVTLALTMESVPQESQSNVYTDATRVSNDIIYRTSGQFLRCVLTGLEDVVSQQTLHNVCVVLERSLVVGIEHLLLVATQLLRDAAHTHTVCVSQRRYSVNQIER